MSMGRPWPCSTIGGWCLRCRVWRVDLHLEGALVADHDLIGPRWLSTSSSTRLGELRLDKSARLQAVQLHMIEHRKDSQSVEPVSGVSMRDHGSPSHLSFCLDNDHI